MSTRVVDRVDDWDSQPFSGGYRQLHQLADRDFSGVIRAGGAELYMIKGTVVGIQRGSIEDFESGSGTQYEAPSPALPLLAVMQERSDEVRDKFYTEKTSISEVDSTLADGGFTGYIELAENVLSGDYYMVYHAGRSMSVAYVGESGRLLDGDEAFETADDEVGIYEVRPVDIDQIEIPEPPEPESGGAEPSDAPSPDHQDSPTEESTDPEPAETTTQQGEPAQGTPQQTETAGRSGPDSHQTSSENTTTTERTATEADGPPAERAAEPEQTPQPDQSETGQSESTEKRTTQRQTDPQSPPETADRQDQRTPDSSAEREPTVDAGGTGTRTESSDRERTAGAGTNTQRGDQQQRRGGDEPGFQPTAGGQPRESTEEQQVRRSGTSGIDESSLDLETRAIPSLDPAHTNQPESTGQESKPKPDTSQRSTGAESTQHSTQQESTSHNPGQGATQQPAGHDATQQSRKQNATQHSDPGAGQPESADGSEPATDTPSDQEATDPSTEQSETVDTERIDELESEIEDRDERIDQLETELEQETAENERLERELETVRNERDELEAEVTELQDELERLETELGAATDAERRMTGAEALSGTDIFVRYHSKGDATLEKAHDGSHRREDVNGNLRLEKHTQFDAGTVAVGGQRYVDFLEGTLEYQFVEWVVRDLLFEIRDTGHTKALKDLYDVLPAIDRAELSGVVDVVYSEDGQETRSRESFDVVLRNRMGNPLLVANLNDSREATTESMMENLITAAERVGQSNDAFSGALFVTESFFEPGALECASESTKGGLLSRDKRKSFVNLSRKRGYHLCLVEARNENFHLAVPEL